MNKFMSIYDSNPIGAVELDGGVLKIRRPLRKDAQVWSNLRRRNEQYLVPWEPTVRDWHRFHTKPTWCHIIRKLSKQSSPRQHMFVIEYHNQFVGQIILSNILYGALYSANCGYWVDYQHWNRGIASEATRLIVQYAFVDLGLHRIEATVQMNNVTSIAVLEKNGFQREGILRGYMNVAGEWRDHILYAITAEQWSG